jgi:hypothetical protein
MSTYAFGNINATIVGPGGSFQLGYGSANAEEGIDIDMIEEKDGMITGADGAVMHSLRMSDSGTITLRYLKTAPINAKLNALYNAQKTSAALWGQNIINVSDVQRGDVVTGTQLAFSKQSPVKYAKDGNIMEWKFQGVVQELLGVGIPDVSV